MRLGFFFLFLFLFPHVSLAAEQVDFLNPRVTSVKTSSLCQTSQTCQTLFFVQGKNFLNSNGKTGLKIGSEWAKVLRVSDSQLVGVASSGSAKMTPLVTVDKTIHRPTLDTDDPVLERMFDESVDVAISSVRVSKNGTRYVSAGPRYEQPPRVYYRDTYWSSGMLLMIEPFVIRDQILLLARGIGDNGSVPSAIPVDPADAMIPLWLDHYDSGPYFIMLVSDYIRFTGDRAILRESVNGKTIYTLLQSILTHLDSLDRDANLLPDKPEGSLQDWADTIPRGGEVISNVVLYAHAIRQMGQLARVMGNKGEEKNYDRLFETIRFQINDRLWNEEQNSYFERCEGNTCVDRLTNESSLAALYDIIEPEHRDAFFDRLRDLETRHNRNLAYGDWGVVNVYPAYPDARPYSYQNMTDWPFLDAMNAGARLKYGNADWKYPLIRWWVVFNEKRKKGLRLPEFVSPVDGSAGNAQSWSVAPMFSFVKYGMGLDPAMDGTYTTKISPDGMSTLRDVVVRGKRITVQTVKQ